MAAAPDPIAAIHRGIILFARSTRIQANDMYKGLSFVAYALLSYVESAPSPHASDLAEVHGLDKSTVSRQLADLEREGLLRRVADPDRSRMQLLKLTPKGRRYLLATRAQQRQALEKRFSRWPKQDVRAFGRLLLRFAVETAEHAPQRRRA